MKNETLLNPKFSEAISHICQIVWGAGVDEQVFRVLDAVTEKQTGLQRLFKKYDADIKANPENAKNVEKLWADKIEEDCGFGDLATPTLKLGEGKNLSAMVRYHAKELFKIED